MPHVLWISRMLIKTACYPGSLDVSSGVSCRGSGASWNESCGDAGGTTKPYPEGIKLLPPPLSAGSTTVKQWEQPQGELCMRSTQSSRSMVDQTMTEQKTYEQGVLAAQLATPPKGRSSATGPNCGRDLFESSTPTDRRTRSAHLSIPNVRPKHRRNAS